MDELALLNAALGRAPDVQGAQPGSSALVPAPLGAAEVERGDEEASKLAVMGIVANAAVPSLDWLDAEVRQLKDSRCCPQRCLSTASDEQLVAFRRDLHRLDKRSREFYALIVLQQCRTFSQRTSKNRARQRDVYQYRVQPIGDVCRSGFMILFGISKGHMDALQLHLRQNNTVLPRVHGNLKVACGPSEVQLKVNWHRTRKAESKIGRPQAMGSRLMWSAPHASGASSSETANSRTNDGVGDDPPHMLDEAPVPELHPSLSY